MAGFMKRSDAACSFCGKSQEQVEKLIAGPAQVFICNECVELCCDILGETLRAIAPDREKRWVTTGVSPQRESTIRQDRRMLLSARLRALENLTEINQAVRACRDRPEAVDILVAAPFNFSGLEAQVILDMGIGHQTVAALSKLRQEIAELSDSHDG